MSSSKRKEKSTSQPPTPPRSKGRDSAELVHGLNERALTLLKGSAGLLLPGLSALNDKSLRRGARFPFLIVDVHFADERWWRSAVLDPQGDRGAPARGPWPAEVAHTLLGEVLVFAWHTARWDLWVARYVLGIVPGVVELVRGLTPAQLDALSRLHSGSLRLRWQEDRNFWARWAAAARDGDEEALADIHSHAKYLLHGGMAGLPVTTVGK